MCQRNDVNRRPISPVARANTNQYGQDQAEDGIRDLVRSRGLGDVYKRQ